MVNCQLSNLLCELAICYNGSFKNNEPTLFKNNCLMLNLCLKLENLWSRQSSQIAWGCIQLAAGQGGEFKAVGSREIVFTLPHYFPALSSPWQTGLGKCTDLEKFGVWILDKLNTLSWPLVSSFIRWGHMWFGKSDQPKFFKYNLQTVKYSTDVTNYILRP